MTQDSIAKVRSLTFLDETGDTTLFWDQDTDDKMIAIIQRKMDEGYVFYITKPGRVIKTATRKVKAKSIAEVKVAGHVIVKDETLEKLFADGKITTGNAAIANDIEPVRRAASANDAATSHSVAVRPARGG